MKQLYKKSELAFALVWIGIYLASMSICNNLSGLFHIQDLFNAPVAVALTVVICIFLSKNKLSEKYGLCKAESVGKHNLYYIPLLLIASTNLWFGVTLKYTILETALGIMTMLCVGFLEEIVFRGFLFKAMAKENLKTAIIVSSVTFGFGHILNLFNGADVFQTILQICYATALGFLFTILFIKGKSLLPCIITHSAVNSLSVIADNDQISDTAQLLTALFLCVVPSLYVIYIVKRNKGDSRKTTMKKRIGRIIKIILIVLVVIVMGILSLSIRPEYSGVNYNSADSQNKTDKTIKFNSNGKLKILHITDTHLEDNQNYDPTIWMIENACDTEKPDIVVVTGDNVVNCETAEDTKKLINGLMNVFDKRNIPVAVTFGNHDSEQGAMSREELMAYYNTFSCSVSVDDGEALSGCGTYNIPVLSSDGEKVKFNLWVFDSGDYDEEGRYSCVKPDQIEWYKQTSDKLKAENNGEAVNSLVFQHIIVGEIYDVLQKSDTWKSYSYKHLYNKDEYYMFDPDRVNYGTIREYPCPGYENYGQFDAMVEKGDVLAMFTGHDHTNAFGVRYKNIDIVNSLSTRYLGLFHSTQCGYRVIEIDENDTSTYETRVERIYDIYDFETVKKEKESGDEFKYKMALEFAVKGKIQKFATDVYGKFIETVTGRQVTYPD